MLTVWINYLDVFNAICAFFSVEHFMGDYYLYQGGAWNASDGDYFPKNGYFYSPVFAVLFHPFSESIALWCAFVWAFTIASAYQSSRSMHWYFQIYFDYSLIGWALNGNADPFIACLALWAWNHPKSKWAGVAIGLCCFKPSFIWGVAIFTLYHVKDLNLWYYFWLVFVACVWWLPMAWLIFTTDNGFSMWIYEMRYVNSSTGYKYYIGGQYPWWWLWLYTQNIKTTYRHSRGSCQLTLTWLKVQLQLSASVSRRSTLAWLKVQLHLSTLINYDHKVH